MFTKLRITVLLLFFIGCGRANDPSKLDETWNQYNDPRLMANQYIVNMGALPTSGEAASATWSDFYWPSRKGGLANRWATNMGGNPWSYGLFSFNNLQRMSPQQIAALSPAEKYDILKGDQNYSLTNYERRRNSPTQPAWAGLCHGWAAATINFPAEPGPVTLRSAAGIDVPFGAADVKGLLALVQQYRRGASDFIGIGQRCNGLGFSGSPFANFTQPECRDVNAGAFHIILTNYLGLQRQAFVADIAESAEVWNFPMNAFYTRIEGLQPYYRNAAPGTAQILRVSTNVRYAAVGNPQWRRTGMQSGQVSYRYTLELDRAGNIIGGEWLQARRPDFLWLQAPPVFSDYLGDVRSIYEASLAR